MKAIMDDSRLTNLNQIKAFAQGSLKLVLVLETIENKYQFVRSTLKRFKYRRLKKRDKRLIVAYLKKLTGYKKAQLFRLIKRGIKGKLYRKKYIRTNPNIIYRGADIKLLEKTDEFHLRLSSLATKEILRREFEIFGKEEYQTISEISSSHINNLRKSNVYKASWVNGTKAREVAIGQTKPPEPNNQPGSIRVDTVHQRDVYHINSVDEIIQWEVASCVPQISELYLEPALIQMLDQYPFVIFNFHSDKGSEFINQVVSGLLNKLLINQTKSRSRHCNDNALVETKNGSVIRKNMGYSHVNQNLSDEINNYYRDFLNPYLNYHRPSLYVAETVKTNSGRDREVYEAKIPYEKLKEVSEDLKRNFLKPNITFRKLDEFAYKYSDNEFAKIVREEERKLYSLIYKKKQKA